MALAVLALGVGALAVAKSSGDFGAPELKKDIRASLISPPHRGGLVADQRAVGLRKRPHESYVPPPDYLVKLQGWRNPVPDAELRMLQQRYWDALPEAPFYMRNKYTAYDRHTLYNSARGAPGLEFPETRLMPKWDQSDIVPPATAMYPSVTQSILPDPLHSQYAYYQRLAESEAHSGRDPFMVSKF